MSIVNILKAYGIDDFKIQPLGAGLIILPGLCMKLQKAEILFFNE